MSHITTTGERAATRPLGRAQPKGRSLWAAGAVLGAGVVLVFALAQAGAGFDSPANQSLTPRAPMDEFIRINTIALDGLVTAPVFRPEAAVNQFLDWNTTRLTGAVSGSRAEVDAFLAWNTMALEYSSPR